jgi:hypothetical protein
MYYRVAIQADTSSTWRWTSTVLISLPNLLQWLQHYRVIPHRHLRLFSATSRDDLNEQLLRENQGLASGSVPVTQFLQERPIASQGAVREVSAGETREHEHTASLPAIPEPSHSRSCMSPLDKRRDELEGGAGGDHDLPYSFTLPPTMPQILAWVKLLRRVEQGDLQLEVVACRSGDRSTCALLDPPHLLVGSMTKS